MRCGARARGRFAAALARGAELAEAARAGGCALATFYNHRQSDAEFAEAWDEALDECSLRVRRRRRRLRGVRREAFLDVLALDCNTAAAARAAGVHRATVYRLIRREAGFALDNEAALARGYEGLERAAEREREARGERLLRSLCETEPCARPTDDFETQMRLLARYDRPAPKPRRGTPPPTPRRPETPAEWIEALGARLEAVFGARVRAERPGTAAPGAGPRLRARGAGREEA